MNYKVALRFARRYAVQPLGRDEFGQCVAVMPGGKAVLRPVTSDHCNVRFTKEGTTIPALLERQYEFRNASLCLDKAFSTDGGHEWTIWSGIVGDNNARIVLYASLNYSTFALRWREQSSPRIVFAAHQVLAGLEPFEKWLDFLLDVGSEHDRRKIAEVMES